MDNVLNIYIQVQFDTNIEINRLNIIVVNRLPSSKTPIEDMDDDQCFKFGSELSFKPNLTTWLLVGNRK